MTENEKRLLNEWTNDRDIQTGSTNEYAFYYKRFKYSDGYYLDVQIGSFDKENDKVKKAKDSERIARSLLYAHYVGHRIRIWYGDTKDGRSWLDEHEIKGSVTRSSGDIKIPLLMNNKRALGGSVILTACIVRIDDMTDKCCLYSNTNFYVPSLRITENEGKFEVFQESGILRGVFPTEDKARKYIAFMRGERYSK